MTRDNPFGKNGITFSSQVRKLNKEIPIIILTSRGKHYVTHDPKYISANVSTVIELPVDIDTMIKTIEQHIK
jgi:DNA-binding NtrC family response regulator